MLWQPDQGSLYLTGLACVLTAERIEAIIPRGLCQASAEPRCGGWFAASPIQLRIVA